MDHQSERKSGHYWLDQSIPLKLAFSENLAYTAFHITSSLPTFQSGRAGCEVWFALKPWQCLPIQFPLIFSFCIQAP